MLLIGISIQVGCATKTNFQESTGPVENTEKTLASPHREPANLETRCELSSSQVANASLIRVTVWPKKFKEMVRLEGSFETIQFPFYPLRIDGKEAFEGLLPVPFDRAPTKNVSLKVKMEIKLESGTSEKAETEEFIRTFQIIEGDYPKIVSENLKVEAKYVNPSAVDLARIRKEQAEVGSAYRDLILQKFWTDAFQLPVRSEFTSSFGSRRIFNGQMTRPHLGADFRAKEGTPVLSSAPGKVTLAKDLYYTGNTVILNHGYGVLTVYAHLSQLDVKPGDILKHQAQLGLSGKTGRVTGAHLHWQAVIHSQKINPIDVIKLIR